MSNFDLSDARALTSNQLVTAPDALQPHFKWNVQVPLDWLYLVTDPEYQAFGIEKIIHDLFSSNKINHRSVGEFADALSKTVDKIRENKILLTFIFPILSSEHKTSMCMLSLKWHDFSPAMVPVLPVHSTGNATNMNFQYCTSKNGINYAVRTNNTSRTHTTGSISCQTFIPVVGTSWACQVMGSAPSPIFRKKIQAIVIKMTESLHFYPNQFASTPQSKGW